MAKESITIIVGVLTLLAASAAVYEILTVNTQIQAKPEQTKVPDYSNDLNSLKTQIGSLNSQISSIDNNLSTLDTLKNSMTDVRAKLTDLQNNNNQVQQVATSTAQLTVVLDKSTYLPGATIKITAVGAEPLKVVQIQLLDSNEFIVTSSRTWADSTGRVSYDLQLSGSLLPGNYQLRLISGQQTDSQPVIIGSIGTSQYPTSIGSYPFTVQTDKAIYRTGDLIQVSGTGYPNTSVTGVMTSLSGNTYSAASTVQPDGSYTLFFLTSGSYEIGTSRITVNNLGQTRMLSIYVESGSSTGSYPFTAQIDKSTYTRGELIRVSGIGYPNTSVIGVMKGPTGNTYTVSTTVQSDGSYAMYYQTLQSYPTGTWRITMTNLQQSNVVYFLMQ
ncbi:MAG: hypothetical protein E6K98_04265 [Thaumarchaeota archaeon]|nr:MAG: hypothetical protein E6K98_04265 [Nitrososphaerota archaeon]TLX94594.1 MAG: hypothetical protein E6K91_05905 [Nitrososphaerota archaeon]